MITYTGVLETFLAGGNWLSQAGKTLDLFMLKPGGQNHPRNQSIRQVPSPQKNPRLQSSN